MSSETLVTVEGVSKKFCRSLKRSLWYGVRDIASDLNPFGTSAGRRPATPSPAESDGATEGLRRGEFWAVNDVSFELRRGDCLGLIGRNGAGKTTLLKMLNGLIKPDRGRIEMRGRIGAIIALGAGFNPILTGRENIYVNGAVLGLTKREIDAKIDDIINFAAIGDFIDSPVQSYSSGMQVRLGFSVATAIQPDVLILDEVLAVGDAMFRFKCCARLDEMRKDSAVIFVSHDTPSVSRICNKTLVMSQGRSVYLGETVPGIEAYSRLNEVGKPQDEGVLECYGPVKSFEISGVPEEISYKSPLTVDLTVTSEHDAGDVDIRVNAYSTAGACVASCVIEPRENHGRLGPGTTTWRLNLKGLPLKSGCYNLSFGVSGSDGELLAVSSKRQRILVTGSHPGSAIAECQILVDSVERL